MTTENDQAEARCINAWMRETHANGQEVVAKFGRNLPPQVARWPDVRLSVPPEYWLAQVMPVFKLHTVKHGSAARFVSKRRNETRANHQTRLLDLFVWSNKETEPELGALARLMEDDYKKARSEAKAQGTYTRGKVCCEARLRVYAQEVERICGGTPVWFTLGDDEDSVEPALDPLAPAPFQARTAMLRIQTLVGHFASRTACGI
jgi:hypothetical protein